MIKCPKCKKQIEKCLSTCPYCGVPSNAYRQFKLMKKTRKTFYRPSKIVDKDKKKISRAKRKREAND